MEGWVGRHGGRGQTGGRGGRAREGGEGRRRLCNYLFRFQIINKYLSNYTHT